MKHRRSRRMRGRTPEKRIMELSRSGALMQAGKKAIEQSHAMGLSVTIIENGIIVRVHPDGTSEQIGIAGKRKRIKKYSGKMFIR